MGFADDLNTALSNLNTSTGNVSNPTSQVGSYQSPVPVPLSLPSWNLTQNDFASSGPSANTPATGSSSDPSNASWADILLNPITGFKWAMDQGNRVSAGVNNTVRDLPNFSTPFGQQIQNNVNDFLQGYQHPDQALSGRQVFDKVFLGGHDVPYLSGIGAFANDMATNPLSYIPVPIGKIAQVTGITPALKAGVDYLKSTPVLDNKVVNSITDFLGNKFVKNYGASPDLVNALNAKDGAHAADLETIKSNIGSLFQQHGLNPDEMNQVVHRFEGVPTSSPKAEQAYQDLQNLLHNGIQTHDGSAIGTNAELNTKFGENPILKGTMENYYPHRYTASQEAIDNALNQSGKPGFSVSGPFNQERRFATVTDALANGMKPEMNPYVAIAQRLAESSKAIRNAQMLNGLKDSGVISKEYLPGLVESDIKPLASYGMKDMANPDNPMIKVNANYLRPQDQQALKNALESNFNSNLYDKALGAWKTASTFNSLVHGHNILYNGMWLGGAKPSYVMDTFKNLKNGTGDEWYQRALRSGAVSADAGKFMDTVRSSLKNVSNPIRDKLSYALHGSLWDLDKSLRTSIFRDAVEKGSSEAEAAAKANKFLIDYNNLTPFEEKTMARIFPFYRWMKGNLPLQVEQWINNTPKQALYEVMKNATNQALTGQPMGEDGKIDTGIVLGDGSHIKIDPYSPADEPLKLMRDGALPFLYSKINPLIKEGAEQATNKAYYPGSPLAPNGKESMANSAIRINGAPENYNIAKSLEHALNNFLPESGVIGSAAGLKGGVNSIGDSLAGIPQAQKAQAPPMTLAEGLTKALGGFSSRDNPVKDAYFQQKDQQAQQQGLLNYMRQTGQPVSKQMTKDAYKKVPFPAAYSGQ